MVSNLQPLERFVFQRLHPEVIPADRIGTLFNRKNERVEINEVKTPWTLTQIGNTLGLHRERIRQIHAEALNLLSAELG